MTRYAGALASDGQKILQAVYDLVLPAGRWPTYRKVDLYLDRHLGIADTQTALVTIPATYLRRPWQPHGFNDTDEVGLTLRGVAICDTGPDDLDLLVNFLQWVAHVERSRDIDDAELILTSDEFAAHLGWHLEPCAKQSTADDNPAAAEEQPDVVSDEPANTPAAETMASDPDAALETSEAPGRADAAPSIDPQIVKARNSMARLRLVTEQVRSFWNGASWQPEHPWRWQYTIHSQGVRAFRDLASVGELLDRQEPFTHEQERQQDESALPARIALSQSTLDSTQPNDHGVQTGGYEAVSDPTAVPRPEAAQDVLLTVLRPEIADRCGQLVRDKRFDDAIFAAYRHVESALQQRAGSTDIGNTLVRYAFVDAKNRIKVSDRAGDADRLVQLFQGPLGLFKGDRSHKDKPAIPCRSLHECIRQLAHASSLLDLLDRDIAVAPRMLGYDHDQYKLTLWMERATAQTRVLLDERPRTVLSQTPVAITIDVADVPSGKHELVFIDGTRQSPGQSVWLTRDPGREAWYRVEQINIPLFTDATCTNLHTASGVRLAVLQAGVRSHRIYRTTESYRVGDYVSHTFDDKAATIGPAWMRERGTEPAIGVFDGSLLFCGEAEAPAHPPRVMKVSLQPDLIRLRVREKAPVRALAHLTDGTATWMQPLDNPAIKSDDDKVAAFNGGSLFAKQPGAVALRLEHDGLYAEATVEVAAHAAGTLTDYVTALPPVVGLASTPDGLVISTREGTLRRVCRDGKLDIAAGLPLQPPVYGGADTIAAAPCGDLAVRLYGHRDVLILDAADKYASSRWVQPPDSDATVTAVGYDNDDLLLGLHTGDIWHIGSDQKATLTGHVEGQPVAIVTSDEGILVLTGGSTSTLWLMPSNGSEAATSLTPAGTDLNLSAITYVKGNIYLTAFYLGEVLRLDGETLTPVAVGLSNPNAITSDPDGTIYIGELGRGAVRRLFP